MSEATAPRQIEQEESQRAKRSGPRLSAASQREIILTALREAGSRGVDNLTFVFKFHISQALARIWDCRKAGWLIDSVANKDDGTVRYVLRGRSKARNDCFEKRATGLPLFDAGVH